MSKPWRATHFAGLAAVAGFILISVIAGPEAPKLVAVQASNMDMLPREVAFDSDELRGALTATATHAPGTPTPPAVGRSLIIEESSAELVGDSVRLLKEPIAPPVGAQGWTTLMIQGFEGTWPAPGWTVFDNDSPPSLNGEYYWDTTNCFDYGQSGDHDAVPHAAGASAMYTCWQPYPTNLNSWMVYGPFDLSSATDAEVLFDIWLDSESGHDYFSYMASINGTNFYGYRLSGYTSDWVTKNFDLTDVYTLGNLAGQPQVWIAFIFRSDTNDDTDYFGSWVDDIILWAYVEATGGDIYGQVTYNGESAPDGIELELRFYDGSSWSTAATTTIVGGAYHFRNMPSLGPGQKYYVRYRNIAGTIGYLWGWYCNNITSYSAGSNVSGGDFDIADVPLGSPDSTNPQPPPLIFNWTIRSTIPFDTYEFHMWDPDGDAEYFSGNLGHVNSYTLEDLPDGFSAGEQYSWDVWVYGPDGVGLSYAIHAVKFSGAHQISLPLVLKYPAIPPTPIPLCNGDFESGSFPPCWTFDGQLPTSIVSGDAPHVGDYAALLGDPELGSGFPEANLPVGSGWIEQEFTVPPTGSPSLSFWYRIYTYDKAYSPTTEEFWDTFVVSIRGGVVFRDGYYGAWTPSLRDLGWRQKSIDLSPYQGQTVRVRFANWNDQSVFERFGNNGEGAYNTWTYLDDVAVTD